MAGISSRHAGAGQAVESSVDLLRHARSGDVDAQESLFARCLPSLVAWVERRVRDPLSRGIDPPAMIRAVLVELIAAGEDLAPRTDAGLQTHLRDALRARIDAVWGREWVDHASTLETAVGSGALEQYEAALGRLAACDREAVVSRIELGQPWEQVASVLGVASVDDCKGRVSTAIANLVGAGGGASAGGRLGSLARAVAERGSVEWEEELLRAADGSERARIEQLRIVAQIGALHDPPAAASALVTAVESPRAEPGTPLAPGLVLGQRFRVARLLGRSSETACEIGRRAKLATAARARADLQSMGK